MKIKVLGNNDMSPSPTAWTPMLAIINNQYMRQMSYVLNSFIYLSVLTSIKIRSCKRLVRDVIKVKEMV